MMWLGEATSEWMVEYGGLAVDCKLVESEVRVNAGGRAWNSPMPDMLRSLGEYLRIVRDWDPMGKPLDSPSVTTQTARDLLLRAAGSNDGTQSWLLRRFRYSTRVEYGKLTQHPPWQSLLLLVISPVQSESAVCEGKVVPSQVRLGR